MTITWDEVRQRCARIQQARLDPAAVFALLDNLPPLDPPSPEPGVARDGVTWEPLTIDEYRAKVAANRAAHQHA